MQRTLNDYEQTEHLLRDSIAEEGSGACKDSASVLEGVAIVLFLSGTMGDVGANRHISPKDSVFPLDHIAPCLSLRIRPFSALRQPESWSSLHVSR